MVYPRVYPLQAEIPKPENLTRATLLMYVGLVIISYVREIPGCNAFHIFYPLVALYFVIQLIYLFTVFDGSVAMLLLLFFLEKSLKYWEWQFRRLCLYG